MMILIANLVTDQMALTLQKSLEGIGITPISDPNKKATVQNVINPNNDNSVVEPVTFNFMPNCLIDKNFVTKYFDSDIGNGVTIKQMTVPEGNYVFAIICVDDSTVVDWSKIIPLL